VRSYAAFRGACCLTEVKPPRSAPAYPVCVAFATAGRHSLKTNCPVLRKCRAFLCAIHRRSAERFT
jgi:hypothetical protein